ncbi:MAG: M20/M25/M40 family metallo-hydrolase [Pyrinomonadaceae bacterium]|nr:M20/M25/M40 family metallo-hydrolase [Pyrinomonadaceae bacterium]
MNLFALARSLIDIPSTTGAETEVGHFLSSYLKSLNYRVEAQQVAEGRTNIIATTNAPPRVTLSTHMDTVPPHFSSREDDKYIHGRGACDAKGIIAAQIAAAEQLRAGGVAEIGLLFTVDEEAGSDGARAANEHPLASSCGYLINGEPTDSKLAIGSKGSLRLRIKTEGRAAHSAYPEHGQSAIDKLLDVLADIRKSVWPTDEFFGETTCNIGTIKGGTRANVVPAEAQADIQIRLVTPAARVKPLLETAVGGRAHLEYLSVAEPMSMLAVPGLAQCAVRFTTDIPYLTNWGAPLLVGPGSILDAHTEHERIAKRELSEAVNLYARLVRTLLARAPREPQQSKAEGGGEK